MTYSQDVSKYGRNIANQMRIQSKKPKNPRGPRTKKPQRSDSWKKAMFELSQDMGRSRRLHKHILRKDRKAKGKPKKHRHYFFPSSKRQWTVQKPVKISTHFRQGVKIRKHYRKKRFVPSKNNGPYSGW